MWVTFASILALATVGLLLTYQIAVDLGAV